MTAGVRSKIRLTIPTIEGDDLAAVEEVLRSGYLVQGTRVAGFEDAMARYVGCDQAIAVSNCTAALHLALLSLGVGTGDRVAVPTYSWPATANVVALCGATPVFVDIQPDSYCMNPEALETVMARAPVKAIVPVHAFGGMADIATILQIAGRHGAAVIEDAACALGADMAGCKAGAWGVMGCFSFHPRKAVTTGEGGIITTDDPALARQLRALRNHGLDSEASKPDFILAGYNLRLTEFQAALGATQLAKLERIIEARRLAAGRYDQLLVNSGITTPRVLPGSRHVYQSYVVLLPESIAAQRDAIMAELKNDGIETAIGTYHIPMTTYFRSRGAYRPGDFRATDDIAARAITLPLYESITAEDQAEVAVALRRHVR